MPSRRYSATRTALRPYSRQRGNVKTFAAVLPRIRVTAEMNAAVRAVADVMGVSVAEVARVALSEFLAVPRTVPTIDNVKEK